MIFLSHNIFYLVDVNAGDDLADEGAVVLLLDVGDQQVEGARALNRSLSRQVPRLTLGSLLWEWVGDPEQELITLSCSF